MSATVFQWPFTTITIADIHGNGRTYSAGTLRNIDYGDKRDDESGARLISVELADGPVYWHAVTLAELQRIQDCCTTPRPTAGREGEC